MKQFKFIDLFCGIGGFHQALTDLGGECVFAIDNEPHCCNVYEKNYGINPMGDITKLNPEDIPEHDLLCGGFPCQPFSKAGSRLGFEDDTKGTLFFDLMRIINYRHPKYVLLENVRNLTTHDNKNTWTVIHRSLDSAGYYVSATPTIFSPHYIGVPQHRERVFIMAVRKDVGKLPEFCFNKKNIPTNNIESILLPDSEIENIEEYKLDQDTVDYIDLWKEFIQGIKCDKLPGFPIWTEYFCDLDESELKDCPKFKREFAKKNHDLWAANKEFIDKWMEKAKQNKLFFGAKAKLEWQAGNVTNPNPWEHIMQLRPSGLRIKKKDFYPALVALVQTSIVGPRKRYLTPRECARLQSFPDTFIYDDSDQQAYKQFGNAVNVEVVKIFAKFLMGDLDTQFKYSRNNQFKK